MKAREGATRERWGRLEKKENLRKPTKEAEKEGDLKKPFPRAEGRRKRWKRED